MEEWRPVEGFENLYKVSNNGQVKNSDGKVLSQTVRGRGYLGVNLHKDGKQFQKYTHRLVADAFLENPNNYPCINHKDENKVNNNIENLEWCDYKHNNSYGTRMSRIAESLRGKNHSLETRKKMQNAHAGKHYGGKKVVCEENGIIFDSAQIASLSLGLNRCAVAEVCRGKSKTAGGYHWRYYE